MKLAPASVLASWPAPNYHDPVRRGPTGQIVSIILAVVAAVVLAMRMYTRLRVVRSFGLDDVLILVAFVRMKSPFDRPFSEILDAEPNVRYPRLLSPCAASTPSINWGGMYTYGTSRSTGTVLARR